jgi:pimeloyl-ACP methyl ester carboxylesterase
MPFANIGGANIWYDVEGSGEPIVLLGTASGGEGTWEFVRPCLNKNFMTVIHDKRGTGQSDRPMQEYNIDVWVSDLGQLLESLNIERAHFWAVGLGAILANKFASTFPDRIGALVTWPDLKPLPNYAKNYKWHQAALDSLGLKDAASIIVGNKPKMLGWANWKTREIQYVFSKTPPQEVSDSEIFRRIMGYFSGAYGPPLDLTPEVKKIRCPTIILMGEDVSPSLAAQLRPNIDLMKESIPGLEVMTIAGADATYYMFYEGRPSEACKIVTGFLKNHPIKKANQ